MKIFNLKKEKIDLVSYGYFDKMDKIINEAVLSILFDFDIVVVRQGHNYNNKENIFIGQKIKVQFDDTFKNYELNMYVIDIIIQNKDDFGILLVPENYENIFPGDINFLLKNFGIDSLRVPKDACFFAKHVGRGIFELEVERKTICVDGLYDAGVVVPQLFTVPLVTKKRIIIYKNFRTNKRIPFCFERIIEEKKK